MLLKVCSANGGMTAGGAPLKLVDKLCKLWGNLSVSLVYSFNINGVRCHVMSALSFQRLLTKLPEGTKMRVCKI